MILQPGDQLWHYGKRGQRLYTVVSVDDENGTVRLVPTHGDYTPREWRETIKVGNVRAENVVRQGS